MFLFILYALIEGYREAYYWYFKSKVGGSNKTVLFDLDLHAFFSVQRGIVFYLFFLFYQDLAIILSFLLMFSFFHNGVYYLTRSFIAKDNGEKDPYPLRFFDQSKTSTALTTKFFTPEMRTILFVVGFVIYLLSQYL
jgi:hypothetical protein